MKRIFSLLAIFVCGTGVVAEVPSYQRVLTSLQGASAQEACVLLNLTYWSYQRSIATIESQKAMKDAFIQLWHAWQNCTNSRLNPSVQIAYPECAALDDRKYQSFKKAVAHQMQTNATYVRVVEYIITHNQVKNHRLQEFIEYMRLQARNETVKSLRICVKNVTKAAEGACHKLRDCAKLLLPIQLLLKTRGVPFEHASHENAPHVSAMHKRSLQRNALTDYVMATIYGFTGTAFMRFDQEYRNGSDLLFTAFMSSQELCNQLWVDLETARASFYRICYMTIMQAMQELNYPALAFCNMFGPQGLVSNVTERIVL